MVSGYAQPGRGGDEEFVKASRPYALVAAAYSS